MRIVVIDMSGDSVIDIKFNHSILDANEVFDEVQGTALHYGYRASKATDDNGEPMLKVTEQPNQLPDDVHVKRMKTMIGELVNEHLI